MSFLLGFPTDSPGFPPQLPIGMMNGLVEPFSLGFSTVVMGFLYSS